MGIPFQDIGQGIGAIAGWITGRAGAVGAASAISRASASSTSGSSDVSPIPADYELKTRSFPENIGSGLDHSHQYNHQMLINISVNNWHTNHAPYAGSGFSTEQAARFTGSTETGGSSKIDYLRSVEPSVAKAIGIPQTPKSKRIKEAILLHMSNVMQFEDRHMYEDVSLTNFAFNATNSGLNRGARIGLGTALNPNIELYYVSTALRQFQFEYLFNPSNNGEADAIYNIYNTLRYHAAPEYLSSAITVANSLLYVSPSVFDITFLHNMKENLKLPRINTCALVSIDMDMAPSGVWAAFKNGTPATQRLSLRFKELDVNTKQRIASGF